MPVFIVAAAFAVVSNDIAVTLATITAAFMAAIVKSGAAVILTTAIAAQSSRGGLPQHW
jgi:hypothetical protein